MPFTNPWSVVIPSGGTAAKLIDDHFRQLRLDLTERFESALFNDFNDDPLVLKADLSGQKVGKFLMVPFSSFIFNANAVFDEHKLRSSAGNLMLAPISLPQGVTMKKVEFLIDVEGGGTTVTLNVRRRSFSTSGGVDGSAIISTLAIVTGFSIRVLPDMVEVVDQNNLYWLTAQRTSVAGSFVILGARVTYDTPNHRATI